jgi:iron-sulfur cluster assembly protein
MIKITDAAAKQILLSLVNDDDEDLKLRIAATENSDGSLEYAMGLVVDVEDKDEQHVVNGVPLVIDSSHRRLLEGMVIDFVEIDAGQPKNFIFLNPNDPNYVPPSEGDLDQIPAKNRN